MNAAVTLLRPVPTAEPDPVVEATASSDGTPPGALTWPDARGRARVLRAWRKGCQRSVGRSPHHLRVAWTLEALFSAKGYAYPSNAFIAAESGLPQNHVEAAIAALAKAGAIIRVKPSGSRKAGERRIYPGSKVVAGDPQKLGVGTTPRNRPPETGGYNKYGKTRARGDTLSSEQRRARQDADRRAARARGERAPAWFDDEGEA